MHCVHFFIRDFMHWVHFFIQEIFIKCLHNNIHFYMWKMKQHAFCFRFETTKEHSNQNKKKSIKTNSKSKFQIWFSNSFKIISGTFWFRALPRRGERHIYGNFCIAHFTLPTNACSFLPTNVRFFHALKFRTLTCESTYLFIMLHKHSIWHFLTSPPKFSILV